MHLSNLTRSMAKSAFSLSMTSVLTVGMSDCETRDTDVGLIIEAIQ